MVRWLKQVNHKRVQISEYPHPCAELSQENDDEIQSVIIRTPKEARAIIKSMKGFLATYDERKAKFKKKREKFKKVVV